MTRIIMLIEMNAEVMDERTLVFSMALHLNQCDRKWENDVQHEKGQSDEE